MSGAGSYGDSPYPGVELTPATGMALVAAISSATAPQTMGLTVTGADEPSITIQVSWDAEFSWHTVQGVSDAPISVSAFFRDAFPALNHTLKYRAVTPDGETALSGNVTVVSTESYLQDPLDPSAFVALVDLWPEAGDESIALKDHQGSADYEQQIESVSVFGSDRPVLAVGQRQAASMVPIKLAHDVAVNQRTLISLLLQSGQVVYRCHKTQRLLDPVAWVALSGLKEVRPTAGEDDPGVAIFDATAIQGRPLNVKFVVDWFTYADVTLEWTTPSSQTYTQVETASPNETYLTFAENPLEGS